MRLAFIHIPKAAGTYARAALTAGGVEPVYLGHVHAGLEAITNVPEVGPIYSCCFVRHPSDWLASLWAWRVEKGPDAILRSALWGFPHDPDWDTFVDQVIDLHPGGVGELFDEFSAGVDYVGHSASIKQQLKEALANAGIAYDVPGFNSVPPQNVGTGLPTISPSQNSRIETAESVLMSAHNPGRG